MTKPYQILLALLFYLGIASLYFGIGVLNHLHTRLVGFQNDPMLFSWLLNWWSYAVTTHINPLWSHSVWAPEGISIANMTAIPSLALPLIPFTKWLGPMATYNLCAIYLSALSAWSAFFLCRALYHRYDCALLGGFIFGFSTYQIGQALGGHLNLLATGILPLFVLLAVQYLKHAIGPKRFILYFSLCLIIQLGISKEIFATSCLMGIISWLIGYFYYAKLRMSLLRLAAYMLLSGLITFTITAPYWLAFFAHLASTSFVPPSYLFTISAQPANLIIPTPITGLSPTAHYNQWFYTFYAYRIENGLYIGLPLLSIFAWHCIKQWRQNGRFMASVFILCLILCLGWGFVWGKSLYPSIPMPGIALYFLPLFSKVLLIRLSIFLWLLVALATTAWLASASQHIKLKWLWACVGIIFIVPSFSLTHRPWYSQGAYLTQIPAQGTITAFTYPNIALPLLWQINSHMRLNLTMAYTGTYPKDQDAVWSYLIAGKPLPPSEQKQLSVQLSKTDLWGDVGGLSQIKQNIVKVPTTVHLVE